MICVFQQMQSKGLEYTFLEECQGSAMPPRRLRNVNPLTLKFLTCLLAKLSSRKQEEQLEAIPIFAAFKNGPIDFHYIKMKLEQQGIYVLLENNLRGLVTCYCLWTTTQTCLKISSKMKCVCT